MLFQKLTVGCLASACLLAFAAYPQAETPPEHTNFSGRWRMVKDKSDFAHATVPDMIVRVIDQRGITMNVHTIQTVGKKTTSADVTYFLDGQESTNVVNGHNAVSKTFWDGPALMVRTTFKLSNGEGELVEDRWELSADGQTLTTSSQISTAKGGAELRLVCVKEKVGS